jgi:uncharacterized membrane protein
MKRGRSTRRVLPPQSGGEGVERGSNPPVADNVRAVSSFEHGERNRRSAIERVSDAIAAVSGSTASLVAHAAFFGSWLLLNTIGMPGVRVFDPFPFGLLTTIVSLEAIFLSLVILNSQSRMSRQAERREHLDLQINMLAEQESTATLKLLRCLCEHEGVDLQAFDAEARHLEKRTRVEDLIAEIDHKVPAG